MKTARFALSVLLAACMADPTLLAQEPIARVRPYDGIQAGYDAFQLGEERRRADIAHQLYLNDQLKYWSGIPTSRGETGMRSFCGDHTGKICVVDDGSEPKVVGGLCTPCVELVLPESKPAETKQPEAKK